MNVDKSKVMVCGKTEIRERLDLSWNEEILEVGSLKYLGSIASRNGDVKNVISSMNEGAKVSGAVNRIWRVGSLGINL